MIGIVKWTKARHTSFQAVRFETPFSFHYLEIAFPPGHLRNRNYELRNKLCQHTCIYIKYRLNKL